MRLLALLVLVLLIVWLVFVNAPPSTGLIEEEQHLKYIQGLMEYLRICKEHAPYVAGLVEHAHPKAFRAYFVANPEADFKDHREFLPVLYAAMLEQAQHDGNAEVAQCIEKEIEDTAVMRTLGTEAVFAQVLEQYKADIGCYPSTSDGLEALYRAPSSHTGTWRGPYLNTRFVDSWGNPFEYRCPGTHTRHLEYFDLWSNGPNGISEPDDPESDDIRNW